MEANEILFRTIVDQMTDAVLICDDHHKVSYANNKMCELLEYSISS